MFLLYCFSFFLFFSSFFSVIIIKDDVNYLTYGNTTLLEMHICEVKISVVYTA